MSNELKISRELAERIIPHIYLGGAGAKEVLAELRALLANEPIEHRSEYGDAYQGAREDLSIWKRRALEAETKVREQDQIIDRLGDAINAENGPVRFGEPFIERQCCTPTLEEKQLLASGDCTPEELWGGDRPTCPKCINAKRHGESLPSLIQTLHANGDRIAMEATIAQPAPVAVLNIRNFANAMIDIALEGGDADGAQIQELAVEHGLLKPEQRTERCGNTCSCAEYADFPVECFRKVKELNQ